MDNVKNEMNIYQKLAVLQDVIKVNKANRNNFANFSYRTIQDILSEVKPHLKDLGLIINFGGGKLDGDKYTLGIIVIDINKPDNRIDETGEIYIDRTKSKMDLSQKVLSAKTFLKKSLLEDLLLISEDADPDSHDNTKTTQDQNDFNKSVKQNQSNNTNDKSNPVKEQNKVENPKLSELKNILYFAADKINNEMVRLLTQYTSFKGKDGKQVPGVTDFTMLNDKRLEVTLSKVKKLYPDIAKKVENLSKK